MSAAQYHTQRFFRTPAMRSLSAVPVTGHFDGSRYKAKKMIPAPNSLVSVKGFLTCFKVNDCLAVSAIHVLVDNIVFLGKALVASAPVRVAPPVPSLTSSAVASSSAGLSCFQFDFGGPSLPLVACLPRPRLAEEGNVIDQNVYSGWSKKTVVDVKSMLRSLRW
jgi:hypothetical protein